MRAARTRACGRSPRASARPGRWSRSCGRRRDLSRHPPAGAGQRLGGGGARATGRNPAATATAAARAISASSRPKPGSTRSTRRCARRWSISKSMPAPAGEMDVVLGPGWPGVMLHEAVGHGLEGDFNRKKTSAFAGLMGQQVAAKGVTVVDDGTIAEPPRLALDRRRGHADQPHRADRGRHPGRLHAGPAERAADGHEADRQRPAREPRARADAAHDQHLHAGGRHAIRPRSSPR